MESQFKRTRLSVIKYCQEINTVKYFAAASILLQNAELSTQCVKRYICTCHSICEMNPINVECNTQRAPHTLHQKLEKHLQKQVQRLNNDKIYCMFQVGFGSNKIQSTGIVILKNLMYSSERFYFLKYNLFYCTC